MVVLLWLSAVFTQAFAEEITYSALNKTPLKLVAIDEYGVASFSGTITIEGEYEVTLDNRYSKNDKFEPYVSFYPNSNSLKYLPIPKSSKPEYDSPPNAIFLTNSSKSAILLLSKSEYKALMDEETKVNNYSEEQLYEMRSLKTFRGFARIKIGSYETAIECDSRWYSARLLSVEQKDKQKFANVSGQLPC